MKKITVMLTVMMMLSMAALSKDYGTFDKIKILRVHDGDTIVCNIEGVHSIVGENIRIRLNDINAAEIGDDREEIVELAQKAKDYLSNAVKNAKKAELRKCGRDTYFRIDAELWLDNVNIGDEMLKKGLVKKYGEKY